jgi:beta-mannanase
MFWETNGDSTTWSPGWYGNTPQKYIAVWRKMVNLSRAKGATNAKWCWCPSVKGAGGSPMKAPLTDFYPGDSYVDRLGLDGYNLAGANRNSWIELEPLMAAFYDEIRTISSTKPFVSGEIGCHSGPGDKALWFDRMRESIPRRFPRVKAIVH